MTFKKLLLSTLLFASTAAFSYEPVHFTFDDGIDKKEITVTKAPQKAVTLAGFMTESLLALGLEDHIVGSAFLSNEVLPEFQEAYKKVKELPIGEGHSVSKEAFIATGVDFVSGWEQSIAEESTGSLDELESHGITPFISSGLAPDSTIENVYADLRLLGKIFDVPQKAEEVVSKMKKDLASIEEKTKNLTNRPRVLLYDSGDGEAFVGGSGLPSDLVYRAGGENIYKDLGQDYATVSFEDIVNKNPEVVVVIEYYRSLDTSKKIDFLKTHPGLKNIDAVKNNRIYVIGLADLAPGIRNAKTIQKLHQMIHGK